MPIEMKISMKKELNLVTKLTPSICPFIKRMFVDFLRKIYEQAGAELCQAQHSLHFFLARAVGVAVGRHSGGRLATSLVATIFIIISPFFLFFFLVAILYFSGDSMFLIEGVLGSNNLYNES